LEILRKTLQDTGTSNYFLSRTLIAQIIRARTDKLDCIKLKNFCTAKGTITRVKRQSTEWENIFFSYSSTRGLMSRINKHQKSIDGQMSWANSFQKNYKWPINA
jgi:hypothetical protein